VNYKDEDTGGRATVTTDEERVLPEKEQSESDLCPQRSDCLGSQVGWL